jgi:DNA-directed RNA polymerase subunit M/transcription elongation factor TFIIS
MENKSKYILNKINRENILNILDEEFDNYDFKYETDEDFIVSNIISLRYDSKNENMEMSKKINNFLINNIDNFKKLNIEIIHKSPYFEELIEDEKKLQEENELEEIVEEGLETCYKCKSKRIRVFYKQVRSGDEGETGFFECSECGNKWTR